MPGSRAPQGVIAWGGGTSSQESPRLGGPTLWTAGAPCSRCAQRDELHAGPRCPGQGKGFPTRGGLAIDIRGAHPRPLSLPCGSHTVSWGWLGRMVGAGSWGHGPHWGPWSAWAVTGGSCLNKTNREVGSVPGGHSENGLRAGGVGGPPISPWAGIWVPVCVGSGQARGAILPLVRVGEVLENVLRWPFMVSRSSQLCLSGRCPVARVGQGDALWGALDTASCGPSLLGPDSTDILASLQDACPSGQADPEGGDLLTAGPNPRRGALCGGRRWVGSQETRSLRCPGSPCPWLAGWPRSAAHPSITLPG